MLENDIQIPNERRKINKEDHCNEDCSFLLFPVKIEKVGDIGTMFNPEPYTYEESCYICTKYKKLLKRKKTTGSFSTIINGIPPYKCDECKGNNL